MNKLWVVAALFSGCVTTIQEPKQEIPAPQTFCELNASWMTPEEAAKNLFRNTWTTKNLNQELRAIAWQESYFNRHLDHEPSRFGVYTTAFGPLGLKPSTAHQEYKTNRNLSKKYPGLDDRDAFLNRFLSSPTFYNDVANSHWWRLKQFASGDVLQAAYGWRWGQGKLQATELKDVLADEYVVKYATREGIEVPQL